MRWKRAGLFTLPAPSSAPTPAGAAQADPGRPERVRPPSDQPRGEPRMEPAVRSAKQRPAQRPRSARLLRLPSGRWIERLLRAAPRRWLADLYRSGAVRPSQRSASRLAEVLPDVSLLHGA